MDVVAVTLAADARFAGFESAVVTSAPVFGVIVTSAVLLALFEVFIGSIVLHPTKVKTLLSTFVFISTSEQITAVTASTLQIKHPSGLRPNQRLGKQITFSLRDSMSDK